VSISFYATPEDEIVVLLVLIPGQIHHMHRRMVPPSQALHSLGFVGLHLVAGSSVKLVTNLKSCLLTALKDKIADGRTVLFYRLEMSSSYISTTMVWTEP
jgi:hypothetical protein